MAIIVELVSRADRVLERHKFDSDAISIGRAYDNDLILSDPYVDAHHARLSVSEAGFSFSDHDAANDSYIGRHRVTQQSQEFNSGARLTLGNSRLRVYRSDHPVAAVTHMGRMERTLNKYSHPIYSIPLLLLVTAVTALSLYSVQFTPIKYSDFALVALSPAGAALIWAGLWSVMTRISLHEPRFFLHLFVTLVYLLILLTLEPVIKLIAFNSATLGTAGVLRFLLQGLASVGLISLNLAFAFHQQRPLQRRLIANGLVWSLLTISLLNDYAKTPDFQHEPSYAADLLAEPFVLVSPMSNEEFLQQAEDVFVLPESP